MRSRAIWYIRRFGPLFMLYAIFIVLYVIEILLPQPTKYQLLHYGITATEAKLASFSVIIPYILVWIIALIGFVRFKSYADRIAGDRDGQAFRVIAFGLFLLALWMPVATIFSNFFAEIYRFHPGARDNLVRIYNYGELVIMLLGFIWIYRGAQRLLPLVDKTRKRASLLINLGYIAFSVFYVYLIMLNPDRNRPTHLITGASYFEPDWLLMLTVILPRLIAWYLGIQTIYYVSIYSQKVKGALYRTAFMSFNIGIAVVVAAFIALRLLQSIPAELKEFSLGSILALLYVLIIFIGIGFGLISHGAKELERLEDA